MGGVKQMKSFGILYKESKESKESKEESQKIDLHINLWNLSSKDQNEGEPSIDFGLKIDHFREISKIQFYFPFLVKENGIIDLYDRMKERDIASMIFNDNNFLISEEHDVEYRISGEKEKRLLLKIERYIEIKSNNIYSILEIDMESIGRVTKSKLNNVYFRFRVKSPSLKKILWLQSKLDNNYFESAFISKQIIDIKVNESRNIEEGYIEECNSGGYKYFLLNKVHFLLAEPASATSTFFWKCECFLPNFRR